MKILGRLDQMTSLKRKKERKKNTSKTTELLGWVFPMKRTTVRRACL